jgi:hypothetical protein
MGGATEQADPPRGISSLLLLGPGLAAVFRGSTWIASVFLVGPTLGLIDLAFPPNYTVIVLESVLAGAALVTAVIVSVGMRTNPGRHRRSANLMAWIFAADAVIYLAPILVLAPFRVSGLFWWTTLALVAASNLALLCLCITVIRRTHISRADLGSRDA